MSAVTDFFTSAAPLWTGTIGSGGVADDTTQTIPLSSVTGLTNGEVYYATIDRVDANGTATPSLREVVKGVLSGSNLIDCTRGVEGTAQQHNAGKVVEILFTAAQWNDLKDGLLVEHNADGTHKEGVLDSIITGSEAGGDLIYHNGSIWTRLAKGTDGQVLKLSSGLPAWGTDSSGLLSTTSFAPQGFLLNGKISVSVA